MRILYYITSHGYGHAVRSAAVCNALGSLIGDDVHITIRSDVPRRFFEEELTVRHDVRGGCFDVGCLQRDGVTVMMEETLRAYSDVSRRNAAMLDDEARWCKDNGVDSIVSDITPFAFEVAKRAGIPSVAVGNFTWHEIYAEYVEVYPQYGAMLSKMADQYRMATTALALYPASPMPLFASMVDVPIIGKKGVCRRGDIFRNFGIDPNKRIGLIYAGNFGLDGINWKRLETFDGWEFIGVYPLQGDPKNYHVVTKDRFRYQDLSASADAVIGKMGYGVFSESLLNGIPLVYLPRENFAEFPVLDAEARRLGAGVCIDAGTFAEVGWESVLNDAVDNNVIMAVDGNGAMVCAREIFYLLKAPASSTDPTPD